MRGIESADGYRGKFLRDEQYNYTQLRVYVAGIADPWVFGPADEFEFDGDEVLVARVGPTDRCALANSASERRSR